MEDTEIVDPLKTVQIVDYAMDEDDDDDVDENVGSESTTLTNGVKAFDQSSLLLTNQMLTCLTPPLEIQLPPSPPPLPPPSSPPPPPPPPRTFKTALQAKKRLQAYTAIFNRSQQKHLVENNDNNCTDNSMSEGSQEMLSDRVECASAPPPMTPSTNEIIEEKTTTSVEPEENIDQSTALQQTLVPPSPTPVPLPKDNCCNTSILKNVEKIIEKKPSNRQSSNTKNTKENNTNTKRRDRMTPDRHSSSRRERDIKNKGDKGKDLNASSKKYPRNWAEFRGMSCEFSTIRQWNEKHIRGHYNNTLEQQFLNSAPPSLPLHRASMKTADREDQSIPFEFLRYTKTKPSISFNVNVKRFKHRHLSREDMSRVSPKSLDLFLTRLCGDTVLKFQKKFLHSGWYPKFWRCLHNDEEYCAYEARPILETTVQYCVEDDRDTIETELNIAGRKHVKDVKRERKLVETPPKRRKFTSSSSSQWESDTEVTSSINPTPVMIREKPPQKKQQLPGLAANAWEETDDDEDEEEMEEVKQQLIEEEIISKKEEDPLELPLSIDFQRKIVDLKQLEMDVESISEERKKLEQKLKQVQIDQNNSEETQMKTTAAASGGGKNCLQSEYEHFLKFVVPDDEEQKKETLNGTASLKPQQPSITFASISLPSKKKRLDNSTLNLEDFNDSLPAGAAGLPKTPPLGKRDREDVAMRDKERHSSSRRRSSRYRSSRRRSRSTTPPHHRLHHRQQHQQYQRGGSSKRSVSPPSGARRRHERRHQHSKSPPPPPSDGGGGGTVVRLPSRSSPVNSPLDGFKRSVADSTISDDMLMSQSSPPPSTHRSQRHRRDPSLSPKRISLDDRINQVLGLNNSNNVDGSEAACQPQQLYDYPHHHHHQMYNDHSYYGQQQQFNQPPPPTIYSDYSYHQRSYCMPPPPTSLPPRPPLAPPSQIATNKLLQVGNCLQVVPTEELPPSNMVHRPKSELPPPPPPPSSHKTPPKPKIVQVGNMLQIVPQETIPEAVLAAATENSTIPPTLPPPPPATIVPTNSVEALLKQKSVERKIEREKRRQQRELRRREKDVKRKEKERRKQLKLKLKTENLIRRALQKEMASAAVEEDEEESHETVEVRQDSSNLGETVASSPSTTAISVPLKGILMKRDVVVVKEETTTAEEEAGVDPTPSLNPAFSPIDPAAKKKKKSVQFADGVRPGEGTSPSGGEELSSPPPISPTTTTGKPNKERRYKKKLKKLKLRFKLAKNTVNSTHNHQNDSDDDDDLLPPSPPPGSPPPHIFPSRVKPAPPPINNIHHQAAAAATTTPILLPNGQYYTPPAPGPIIVNPHHQPYPMGLHHGMVPPPPPPLPPLPPHGRHHSNMHRLSAQSHH